MFTSISKFNRLIECTNLVIRSSKSLVYTNQQTLQKQSKQPLIQAFVITSRNTLSNGSNTYERLSKLPCWQEKDSVDKLNLWLPNYAYQSWWPIEIIRIGTWRCESLLEMDTPFQLVKQFCLIVEWHVYVSAHRCIICLSSHYRNISTLCCCLNLVVDEAACFELVHLQMELWGHETSEQGLKQEMKHLEVTDKSLK